jgi:UDP-N-acetylmuramoylalanine--D-glutamate ligase
MQGYFKAKTHRFVVPGVKSLVTNADDLWGAKLNTANTIFTKDSNIAAGFKGLAVLVDYRPADGVDQLALFESGRETKRLSIKPRLLGGHNRLNIAAAIAAGIRAGLSLDGVIKSVESFTSLEHRIEMVRELDGVVYINDSKATTVAASGVAISTVLEAYPNRAVYILLGGLSKFGSWAPLLRDTLSGHNGVKLVFFGKDGEMIRGVAREFGRDGPCFGTMSEAVQSAREAAAKDRGVVLFSPGCASFDAFRDFEDRGEKFKAVVNGWR